MKYFITIGISEKPLLNIIDNNFPNQNIFDDDSFLYGVVAIILESENKKELLNHLDKLQIYSEDIIKINQYINIK